MRRMTARGLLVKEKFGGGAFAVTVYRITDAGRAKLAEAIDRGWIPPDKEK